MSKQTVKLSLQKSKSQTHRLPGLTDTPFPMRSPKVYGNVYLSYFQDYLHGKIDEKQLIASKNLLLTQKKKFRKNTKKLMTTLQMSKIFPSSQRVSPTRNNSSEKCNGQELAQFVSAYNKGAAQMDEISTQVNSTQVNSAQVTMRKLSILPFQSDEEHSPNHRIKVLKDLIESRRRNKKKLRDQEDNRINFKIISNFVSIAEDYKNKIRNRDLIHCDTSKPYLNNFQPKTTKNCKLFTIRKFQEEKRNIKALSDKDHKNQLKYFISQQNDNYIEKFTSQKPSEAHYHDTLRNSLIDSGNSKTQIKILDKQYQKRIDEFLRMKDQEQDLEKEKEIKRHFLQSMTQLETVDDYGTIKSRYQCKSEKQKKGKSVKFSHSNNLASESYYDESDHQSNISFTEVNIDKLYQQSHQIQSKVLDKQENLSRLMKHFMKIEGIKNKILDINKKKLNNYQNYFVNL